MAAITINVPDAQATRVIDAVCVTQGYSATISDPANPSQLIPNPQTKAQFVRVYLASHIRAIVVSYEADVAAAQSRQTSDVSVA